MTFHDLLYKLKYHEWDQVTGYLLHSGFLTVSSTPFICFAVTFCQKRTYLPTRDLFALIDVVFNRRARMGTKSRAVTINFSCKRCNFWLNRDLNWTLGESNSGESSALPYGNGISSQIPSTRRSTSLMVFITDVKEETWLGPTVVYSALVNVGDIIEVVFA